MLKFYMQLIAQINWIHHRLKEISRNVFFQCKAIRDMYMVFVSYNGDALNNRFRYKIKCLQHK